LKIQVDKNSKGLLTRGFLDLGIKSFIWELDVV